MAERTTVILGYSLADPNLRSILHAFNKHSAGSGFRGNVIYLSRKPIPSYLRDHFEAAFGVCVVDNTSIDDFFRAVQSRYKEAEEQVVMGRENLSNVLKGSHHYTDSYLKSHNSLAHIIAVANEVGEPITSAPFLKLLQTLLEKKMSYTNEGGAWEQYRGLALWLTYLGGLLKIRGTTLEEPFLKAVFHSMNMMSGKGRWAHSWAAYSVWKSEWNGVMFDNRQLVREYMTTHQTAESDDVVHLS